MSSNFEKLQKIINQAYAENFSCLFHVPRSPYLWPRWSGPFLSQLLLRGFVDLSSKSFDFKSFGALFAISGALKYYKLELFFNKFAWILQLYVICSKHTVYKYLCKKGIKSTWACRSSESEMASMIYLQLNEFFRCLFKMKG